MPWISLFRPFLRHLRRYSQFLVRSPTDVSFGPPETGWPAWITSPVGYRFSATPCIWLSRSQLSLDDAKRVPTLARMLAFMYSMLMAVLFLRGCCFKVLPCRGARRSASPHPPRPSSSRCCGALGNRHRLRQIAPLHAADYPADWGHARWPRWWLEAVGQAILASTPMWAFMPKCHWLPFLGLMHLRIALLLFVLGRAGSLNDGGIDQVPWVIMTPASASQRLMVLNNWRPVDAAPAGGGNSWWWCGPARRYPGITGQTDAWRRFRTDIFHRAIAQVVPMLHAVNA